MLLGVIITVKHVFFHYVFFYFHKKKIMKLNIFPELILAKCNGILIVMNLKNIDMAFQIGTKAN